MMKMKDKDIINTLRIKASLRIAVAPISNIIDIPKSNRIKIVEDIMKIIREIREYILCLNT